jgi:squalene synthase HpnC
MVGAHVAALVSLPLAPPPLDEALRCCRRLACSHYENFHVLSWIVPRTLRDPSAVLYAYCRTVDDVGDEAPGDRDELLDRCDAELDAAFRGRARHPVFVALQTVIDRLDLPREPFARLIEANRIDQRTTRYATFEQLLHYCERSANPVGRLVLMLYGHRDEERFQLSDATCTALQLTNFWQDLARDFAMGRIYLPQEEMAAYEVRDEDLAANVASENLRALTAFQVARARRYFVDGFPLVDRVRGRLCVAVSLFSRGGLAILGKIEDQRFDTLVRRPTLSNRGKAALAVSTLVSRRWRRWT